MEKGKHLSEHAQDQGPSMLSVPWDFRLNESFLVRGACAWSTVLPPASPLPTHQTSHKPVCSLLQPGQQEIVPNIASFLGRGKLSGNYHCHIGFRKGLLTDISTHFSPSRRLDNTNKALNKMELKLPALSAPQVEATGAQGKLGWFSEKLKSEWQVFGPGFSGRRATVLECAWETRKGWGSVLGLSRMTSVY